MHAFSEIPMTAFHPSIFPLYFRHHLELGKRALRIGFCRMIIEKDVSASACLKSLRFSLSICRCHLLFEDEYQQLIEGYHLGFGYRGRISRLHLLDLLHELLWL